MSRELPPAGMPELEQGPDRYRQFDEKLSRFVECNDEGALQSVLPMVLNSLVKAIGNRSLAEEAMQMTMIALIQSHESFAKADSKTAYMLAVAHRIASKLLRTNEYRESILQIGSAEQKTDYRTPSPESVAVQNETRERLAMELATLNPIHAEIVHLRLEGMLHEDIATKLGKDIKYVRGTYSKTSRHLLEFLGIDNEQ